MPWSIPSLTEIGKMKALVLLAFVLSMVLPIQAQEFLTWEVFHPVKKVWMPFGQKGSVQECLWQSGELPDPYIADNETRYQWIEDHDWTFRTQFYLHESFAKADTLVLDLPNLDTYATILINGKEFAHTDNFFVHYRISIPVKQLLCGYNSIELKIVPPVRYHAARYANEAFHYPAPNDQASVKVAPYTRKPQYQFGWDWALRMNTIGFSAPITIAVKAPLRVVHCIVSTLALSETDAQLELNVALEGTTLANGLRIESRYFNGQSTGGQSAQKIQVRVKNPRLWWPNGQGEAFLYKDTLRFYDAEGHLLLSQPYYFGIRTVRLVQEADQWGTSFAFEINGRKVFVKGANLIPPSVFPAQLTPTIYQDLVAQMQAANFNAVRVWGGGLYPSDAFFEACSKAGLMVWQDFMFACAMYPADKAFLATVQTELEQQIPRLVAHPSLIYLNGNNEVDVAWKNWGFQTQYKLDAAAQQQIEAAYKALFQTLIPEEVAKYTTLPYVHTSPLSNWGKPDFFNHGTMHYWGVWHGADPLSDFADKIGRFNAEYGFQSFPEISTLATFATPKQFSLNDPVMKHHQKSYVGNGMIAKHATALYSKTNDFRRFVYHSQLTQREAVSSAIAGHRLDVPRCAGTIYWQLNDCWAAPTWSSIDYFGNWKALQYAVQDDYRPIAVLQKNEGNAHYLVLLSEVSEDTLVTVQVERFDINGKSIGLERRTYPVQPNTPQVLLYLPESTQGFVRVSLDERYSRLFSYVKARPLPNRAPFICAIQPLDAVSRTGEIVIENTLPLPDLWIYSESQGLHFERNFETLLPGQHTLKFTYQDHLPTVAELTFFYR
jgi:beta-mannosidase